MEPTIHVTTLFLDIGGVLLTNGWGRDSRRLAAEHFNIDFNDSEERHHLSYSIYEEGKLTLNEYLNQVIFFNKRPFSVEQFRDFMFAQSVPDMKMINLIQNLKALYNLKIAVVNNEGRELNEYRIMKFGLNQFVDFFISSCFIHVRKPDLDIFKIALDVAQVSPEEVAYLEDRVLFVDIARELGIKSIHHKDFKSTSDALASLGLETK
jgi:putative hydrolase of the HAD superfamily